MADQDTRRRLAVVHDDRPVEVVHDAPGRAAYWARVQALRLERQRLRAG